MTKEMSTGKATTHQQDEHHEVRPDVGSDESNLDLEKHASNEVGSNYLSQTESEEGDYFVTAKTWAVVVVSIVQIFVQRKSQAVML